MNVMLSYWYNLYMHQTPAERKLEKELCKLGVRYRSQHPVLSAKAILDFLLPDYNLVIEVDDPGHLKKKNIKKDRERTDRLSSLGLKVVRFSNDDVLYRIKGVVTSIQEALRGGPCVSVALSDTDRTPKRPRLPKSRQIASRSSRQVALLQPLCPS